MSLPKSLDISEPLSPWDSEHCPPAVLALLKPTQPGLWKDIPQATGPRLVVKLLFATWSSLLCSCLPSGPNEGQHRNVSTLSSLLMTMDLGPASPTPPTSVPSAPQDFSTKEPQASQSALESQPGQGGPLWAHTCPALLGPCHHLVCELDAVVVTKGQGGETGPASACTQLGSLVGGWGLPLPRGGPPQVLLGWVCLWVGSGCPGLWPVWWSDPAQQGHLLKGPTQATAWGGRPSLQGASQHTLVACGRAGGGGVWERKGRE